MAIKIDWVQYWDSSVHSTELKALSRTTNNKDNRLSTISSDHLRNTTFYKITMKKTIILATLLVSACALPPVREPNIEPIVVPVQDSIPFNPEGYTLEGEFQDDTIGQPKS